MKRYATAIFILALALALSCELKTTTTQVPSTGEVCLQVEPASADVFVDGKFAGRASEFRDKCLELQNGRHRIMLVKPGFETYEEELYVGSAKQSLKVKLVKADKGKKK